MKPEKPVAIQFQYEAFNSCRIAARCIAEKRQRSWVCKYYTKNPDMKDVFPVEYRYKCFYKDSLNRCSCANAIYDAAESFKWFPNDIVIRSLSPMIAEASKLFGEYLKEIKRFVEVKK